MNKNIPEIFASLQLLLNLFLFFTIVYLKFSNKCYIINKHLKIKTYTYPTIILYKGESLALCNFFFGDIRNNCPYNAFIPRWFAALIKATGLRIRGFRIFLRIFNEIPSPREILLLTKSPQKGRYPSLKLSSYLPCFFLKVYFKLPKKRKEELKIIKL